MVRVARVLAESTGMGETFFGSLFLGAVSSMPEASTAVAALRKRLYDMAVGNILGANMINLMLILFCDLLYPGASVLEIASLNHVITAGLGILMTAIVIIGIIYRSSRSFACLGWDSAAIAACFAAGHYALFVLR